MADWKTIKPLIEKETRTAFKQEAGFNFDEVSEIFYKLLVMPLANADLLLDGIEKRVPNALEKVLVGGIGSIDYYGHFIEAVKIEPFLRKLLYLIDPEKLSDIAKNKRGFNALIQALKLNPNKIDFEKSSITQLVGKSDFSEHLYRVYHLRNIESHQCKDYTLKELTENLESVLVIYLYAINKYKNILKPISESVNKEPEFNEYLESVISAFKKRIGKFVHIRGQEDLKLTQGFVIESIPEDNEEDDESELLSERKGTVDELRKNRIPENRMIIWGEAGMGKSTTLEYLAYIDAKERLKKPDGKLPVYMPLGLLTDKNVSLKQAIFKKIDVDEVMGDQLLKNGRINLFLDGVNEVPRDDNYQLKTLRLREIENILSTYKKSFIIISSRPEEENIFRNVPVFLLQKMDKELINDFIIKNTEGNKTIGDIIINEIDKDDRLEKIVRTPLMLSRLIEIVKSKGNIPKSEGEIIHNFIHSLYVREREEKKDAYFNIKVIHRLLRYLGYESLEKKDTNAGMTEDEVLNYFVACSKEYGIDIDTIYVLEIATQLGILEKRDDMYSFAHQAYQDYYHAQQEKAILGI